MVHISKAPKHLPSVYFPFCYGTAQVPLQFIFLDGALKS